MKNWDNVESPNSACPHEVIEDPAGIRRSPCKENPLKNGWCAFHQYAYQFMAAGASLGYPAIDINESLSVGVGEGSWMAYATHYLPRATRQKQVRQALAVAQQKFREAS